MLHRSSRKRSREDERKRKNGDELIKGKHSRRQKAENVSTSSSSPGQLSHGGVYGRCDSVTVRFDRLECIGSGTYGTVYRSKDKKTGKSYALKRVILHHEKADGFPITSMREIRVLRSLQHRNIVKLRDVVVGAGREDVFLVFEYCEHDMSTLMRQFRTNRYEPNNRMFSPGALKRLMLGLSEGLHFLHSRTIVHRDLKMANLLYTSRGIIKIADFGMARWMPQPIHLANLSPKVMTLWYRAPEMLLGADTYTRAVDLWSLGCIFAELWHGEPLFPGATDAGQTDIMFKTLGAPSESSWPGLKSLPNYSTISFKPKRPQKPYDMVHRLRGDQSSSAKKGSSSRDISRNNGADPNREFNLPLVPLTSPTGIRLISGLLQFHPARRTPAGLISENEFFRESPLPLSEDLMPTFPTTHRVRSDRSKVPGRAKG